MRAWLIPRRSCELLRGADAGCLILDAGSPSRHVSVPVPEENVECGMWSVETHRSSRRSGAGDELEDSWATDERRLYADGHRLVFEGYLVARLRVQHSSRRQQHSGNDQRYSALRLRSSAGHSWPGTSSNQREPWRFAGDPRGVFRISHLTRARNPLLRYARADIGLRLPSPR
jgi:hypothetical protein